MGNFKATFWSGSAYSVSANGTTISTTDYSNYANYFDTATGGGATYVDLAADASDYNDFYKGSEIGIIAGTGVGSWGICTAFNGTTKRATVVSWSGTSPTTGSTYEIGERGHLQSY